MNILVFLPSYALTIQRGDTTHIKELVSNLSKLAEIDVIKANGSETSERVPLMAAMLRVMQGFVRAALLLRKRRPDLIYTRDSQALFTFVLARLFRLPYIVEINALFISSWKVETRPLGIRRWASYIKGSLNEKTFKYADHLIAVQPKIKKILELEYNIKPEKISAIGCGANTELFRPMNTQEARRALQLNEKHNYICFVGALYKWQGIEYLIKASPNILEQCSSSVFLIVGDGYNRETLANLADGLGVSDRFIFTGVIPYASVPLYINASDLCVAPFIEERNGRTGLSPNKVYEYLACGKPVVASDIDGVRELLEGANAGICVPAEDPDELANAVVNLLRSTETRERMGESGRSYAVENGSWESVAGRVFKVCQRVVQEH